MAIVGVLTRKLKDFCGRWNQSKESHFLQNKVKYYLHSKTGLDSSNPLGNFRHDLHHSDYGLISRFNPFQVNVPIYSPWKHYTAWKVSKYGFFSGPNTGKYGPEKTSYLDTFHAVLGEYINQKRINANNNE